ncbi:hypothetical protein CTZ27_15255 [Streptomyces griseocarneus]|nr:hypothetical protein CTZ27_15255 [Streptomyces griseocarneus]
MYVVLETHCQRGGANYFRIEFHKDELPALFDSRLFEVVDPRIHSSWTISIEWDGSLTMAPASWQAAGFWECLMDHSPHAIDVYEASRDALVQELQ